MTQTFLLPEPSIAKLPRLHLHWDRNPRTEPSLPARGPGVGEYEGFRVSASVRLDNRYELTAELGLRRVDTAHLSDADLLAAAFARWGERCLDHVLGDFAFAVWDPHAKRLFCARDAFGVKPFYYHCSSELFVCGSEMEPVTAHAGVPLEVDRGRVADFLVKHLEGIDDTGTFYRQIHRLPPAHWVEITPQEFKRRRFWRLERQGEVGCDSDAEYARAFWNELSIAVGRRHRDIRQTAIMLSGGLDSSSIVAAARDLDPDERRAIRTLSIVAEREPDCIESQCIEAVIAEDSVLSRVMSVDHLAAYLDPIFDSVKEAADPFDCWMNLQRVIYLAAQRAGFAKVIDGVDGDLVISHGASLIPALLSRGRCWRAFEEARGQSHFHYRDRSTGEILMGAARQAWIPERMRQARRRRTRDVWLAGYLQGSVIHPDFVDEIDLPARLDRLEAQRVIDLQDLGRDQASLICHPYTAATLERYHRAAAAFGIEARHPYFDRELVEFCLTLPSDQRVKCGWTKYIVRQAAQGKLPTEVVWRKGDWRRLNSAVTDRLVAYHLEEIGDRIETALGDSLQGLVDAEAVRGALADVRSHGASEEVEVVWQVAALALWLEAAGCTEVRDRPALRYGSGGAS